MRKLDRLGWEAGMIYAPYGTRLGIRTNDRDVLEHIERELLLPTWEARRSGSPIVDHLYSLRVGPRARRRGVRNYHLLYTSTFRLARTHDLAELLETFDQYIHIDVASSARRRTFVHAGVVGWKGRAIVIPGRTRAGKSTLVKALVDRGATFYSDEYAVIDGRGRVHDYPRDLSLRRRAGKQRIPAQQLREGRPAPPLPIGAVVLTRFERGSNFAPSTVPRGRAALDLFAHCLSARREPQRDLKAFSRSVSGAVTLQGVRGEAPAAARTILGHLQP